MVTYYLDTSVVVKLYVNEPGSEWLRERLRFSPSGLMSLDRLLLSSALLRVEAWSAFTRRMRDGTVGVAEYRDLIRLFDEHCRGMYRLVILDERIIEQACRLIESHPLRGYDAVHLSTALYVNQRLAEGGKPGLIFLSSDDRLNDAAIAEGLSVDNPNYY